MPNHTKFEDYMRTATLALTLTGLIALAACSKGDDTKTGDTSAATAAPPDSTPPAGATTAAMLDATGKQLGVLTLSDASGGINIKGSLKGLAPGAHGIHLHTTGACTPNFAAAGGHWNPTNKEHGKDNPKGAHLGDMLNITAGADSSASVDVTTSGGTLSGADMLVDADGAAIVVHATADDYKSNPAGNSGDRIACGVVTKH